MGLGVWGVRDYEIGAMPDSTSNYSDKEIDQLAEYVMTLRKK